MKTSELSGVALDWAVAKCEGNCEGDFSWYYDRRDTFNYSIDWSQGGPIIDREHIGLWSEGYDWEAKIQTGVGEWLAEWDASPLIAAMRCYVASKLGDNIDIPEELQ